METYELIDKEWIKDISFPIKNVITSETERKKLSSKIYRATSLGNIENHKVVILFEDNSGPKKVFTTIWAQTREKIILKKGVAIPINRIYDIRFS